MRVNILKGRSRPDERRVLGDLRLVYIRLLEAGMQRFAFGTTDVEYARLESNQQPLASEGKGIVLV